MKVFKFLAFAWLLACPMVAQAGILGPLSNLGAVKLEDDDWETQISGGGDGFLDVGDLLLAVISVQAAVDVVGTADGLSNGSLAEGSTIATYSPTTRSVTGISLISVATIATTVGSDSAVYTFKGGSMAEWLGLGIAVGQDNTGAILFDDPINVAGHIDFSTIASGIASTIEGIRLAEFTVDAWRARAVDEDTFMPTVVSAIDSLTFVAGLSTTDSRFGTVDVLRDPDFGLLGPNLGFFTSLGPVDLQLFGGLGTGDKGAWALRTDTDLYVNIVPEPASFAIWSLVAGIGGLGFRRRMR